jgi:hypothetical protein
MNNFCSKLNILKNIYNSSLFETILTNKYELLTFYTKTTKNKIKDDKDAIHYNNDKLFIDKYELPPIINKFIDDKLCDNLLHLYSICNAEKIEKISIIFIGNKSEHIISFFKKKSKHVNVIYIDNSASGEYSDTYIYINIKDMNYKNNKVIDFLEKSDYIYIFNNESIIKKMPNMEIELEYFFTLISIFSICLLSLEFNGVIYYEFMYFIHDETFKFLNYISNHFNKIVYHNHIITTEKIGFISFNEFNKNVKKIQSLNKNLITNYDIIGGKKEKKYKMSEESNKMSEESNKMSEESTDNNIKKYIVEPPNITLFIVDLENDISSHDICFPKLEISNYKIKFIQLFFDIYEKKIVELNKKYKEILYVREHHKKILIDIHPYITTLVSNGIEFCEKYNIEINKYYIDFVPLNNTYFIEKYFKKVPNVNLNNIKISVDSNYSITLPIVTERMVKYIKKNMPSIKYIIDGTANIGSTGITLSFHFNHIYSVELIKTTYDILTHNVTEYKIQNMTTFNESIITFMENIKKKINNFNTNEYCLFLDPPWTGVFYKTEDMIDLYLDDINIIDFIKKINIKYICLKVPYNYNMSYLYKAFYNIIIYRVSGFYFILITIY